MAKPTREAGYLKNPRDPQGAQASSNWEELQQAAVATEKSKSFNRDENRYALKTSRKLAESLKQEAASHRQHQSTTHENKSRISLRESLQDPRGGAAGSCELLCLILSHSDHSSERPTATKRKSKSSSSPAATEDK